MFMDPRPDRAAATATGHTGRPAGNDGLDEDWATDEWQVSRWCTLLSRVVWAFHVCQQCFFSCVLPTPCLFHQLFQSATNSLPAHLCPLHPQSSPARKPPQLYVNCGLAHQLLTGHRHRFFDGTSAAPGLVTNPPPLTNPVPTLPRLRGGDVEMWRQNQNFIVNWRIEEGMDGRVGTWIDGSAEKELAS